MSFPGALVWDVLTAVGGTLALTLIIALAVGINGLAVLFAGSAVVALEQFAQVARRRSSVVALWIAWSALAGFGYLTVWMPELAAAPWREALWHWAQSAAVGGAAIAAAMAIAHLGVRRVGPQPLATVSLAWPGLGLALVIGGSGRLVYAAAPALLIRALALGLALRRRRRANGAVPARSQLETLLRVLAAALAVGIVPAALLAEPQPAIAEAGGALLAAFGG